MASKALKPEAFDRPASERMSGLAQGSVVLYLLAALAYLGWRATTLNPAAPIFSWLIYGAELFAFVANLLHLFMVWNLTVRKAPAPEAGLTVDIFIPTYNEPVEMLRRTLLAAKNVDYPHEVWLLDDGRREDMRQLAIEMQVHYLARSDNRHAKAGNLNHALPHSKGDFIAIFDADHAPRRNFLTATLGFFRDPRVAFVQTPQDFFNLDSFQHRRGDNSPSIWTEQSLFFRVIQRGKDYWNAAFFCGSCAIIRRSALDAVGGFQTDSITEDLETSVAVHKAGFKSVYVPDALAFGIAPASASSYLRQRVRWGQGAMQVIRKELFFLRGRLTVAQRLNYMASTLTYFDGWQKGLFYLAPAWVLVSGSMPLVAHTSVFLPLFLPYLILTFICFEEVGRGYGRSLFIEQYNMARFAGFIWATFGLVQRNLKFMVTDKDNVSARAQEVRVLSPQIGVAALNLAAIIAGIVIWTFFSTRGLPLDGLIANVIWASINIGMAALVVRFTLDRTRYKRLAYRFAIPLPASLDFDGKPTTMTVDNISSTGARLYGDFPRRLAAGDLIQGQLHLPGEVLPFSARIATLFKQENRDEDGQYAAALGIRFEWPDAISADRLSLFLYGSDLQWQFQRLEERVETPTERLAGLFRKPPVNPLAGKRWATIRYEGCDGPAYGLISVASSSGLRVVVTDQRLHHSIPIQASKYSRRQPQGLRLTPKGELAHVATPTATLYLTEVTAVPMMELSQVATPTPASDVVLTEGPLPGASS